MSDITFNRYAILGTAAERALFVPDPTDISSIGPGEFLLVVWVERDTGDSYYWDAVALAWVLQASAGGGAPVGLTYLTDVDETATLVNSRRLLAGTDVAFDDTTPGERTINVNVASSSLSPFLLMGG